MRIGEEHERRMDELVDGLMGPMCIRLRTGLIQALKVLEGALVHKAAILC